VVCLGPLDPVDIAGPRPLSGVVVRPLNFTVRGQPLLDRSASVCPRDEYELHSCLRRRPLQLYLPGIH
jgi:hypothetical protein